MTTGPFPPKPGIAGSLRGLAGSLWNGEPISGNAVTKMDKQQKEEFLRDIQKMETSRLYGALNEIGSPMSGAMEDPYDMSRPVARSAALQTRMRATMGALRETLHGLDTTYADGKIFVHFVRDGEMVVFTDDAAMFPSDTLINQLRLAK